MDAVPWPAADADGERALVRACAAGSPGAFEEIIRRHQPRVARLVRRLLGWPEDVEDVVQEVFMTVLSRSGRYRGESALGTWITAIAVNRCRTWRRRVGVRFRGLRWMLARAEKAAAPADTEAIRRDRQRAVRAAILTLPVAYREVIVLHYLEDLPLDAIARILGLRRNTLEVRLHRARQRLGVLLKGVQP
jgi:RNA polymerase sigma-70 factor (ECF subfamily)